MNNNVDEQRILFKKKTKKNKTLRKKETSTDDVEDETNLDVLNDIKRIQKYRKQKGGLDVDVLSRGTAGFRERENGGAREIEDDMDAADFDKKAVDAAKNVSIGITDAFGAETGIGTEENVEDEYMRKYVNDKLGTKKGTEEEEVDVPEYVKEDNALYSLPKQIKMINDQKDKAEADLATAEGVGVGIAEVELPMSFKLKNIEQTELASRKKLEENEKKKLGIFVSSDDLKNTSGGGSLTANYNAHHSKYISNIKRKFNNNKGSKGKNGGNKNGENKKLINTDDMAMSRFRKKMRRF